jgi:hypothetical protein
VADQTDQAGVAHHEQRGRKGADGAHHPPLQAEFGERGVDGTGQLTAPPDVQVVGLGGEPFGRQLPCEQRASGPDDTGHPVLVEDLGTHLGSRRVDDTDLQVGGP